MASTSKCPYCGSTVSSDEVACKNCGAPNELYVADTPRVITHPTTIEELQEYCAERGMPLLRMRFFIGEDFKEPKAFGIYRDGRNVVVYKNKADGTRAIRYQGPDEAHGVKELYDKLLEECHNRGIYPDGKPPAGTRSGQGSKMKLRNTKVLKIIIVAWLAIAFFMGIYASFSHRGDGYYKLAGSDYIYYRYAGDWYYSSPDWADNTWYETTGPSTDYSDYKIGDNWDSDWNVGDFKASDTWDDIRSPSDGGSSDYDSWDSGGTDWGSDW